MTQANDPNFPRTSSGTWYPKDYVAGVIDDLQEAQKAHEAFKNAGYQSEEVRLMESSEAAQQVEEHEQEKSPLQHFLSSFQSTTDETGAFVYQQEARKGNHILYVHANSKDDAEGIASLMQQYHAHAVKFFGRWSVADMHPRDPSAR